MPAPYLKQDRLFVDSIDFKHLSNSIEKLLPPEKHRNITLDTTAKLLGFDSYSALLQIAKSTQPPEHIIPKPQIQLQLGHLPARTKILFENSRELQQTIPYPRILKNHAPRSDSEHGELYQVIFDKKNGHHELMKLTSGELAGLSTTTCMKQGRFSGIAGLKKVSAPIEPPFYTELLGLNLTLLSQTKQIFHVTQEIREHQIKEKNAEFMACTMAIVECFERMPEILTNQDERNFQLTALANITIRCKELYHFSLQKFQGITSDYNYKNTTYGAQIPWASYIPNYRNFIFENKEFSIIFTTIDLLIAEKVCRIMVLNNYTPENINQNKKHISKEIETISELINKTINNIKKDFNSELKNINTYPKDYTVDYKNWIEHLIQDSEDLTKEINEFLQSKVYIFDLLTRFSHEEKINVSIYVHDGYIIINDPMHFD